LGGLAALVAEKGVCGQKEKIWPFCRVWPHLFCIAPRYFERPKKAQCYGTLQKAEQDSGSSPPQESSENNLDEMRAGKEPNVY